MQAPMAIRATLRVGRRSPAGGSLTTSDHRSDSEGGTVPAELTHTMIRVRDEERSLAFYKAVDFEERGRRASATTPLRGSSWGGGGRGRSGGGGDGGAGRAHEPREG